MRDVLLGLALMVYGGMFCLSFLVFMFGAIAWHERRSIAKPLRKRAEKFRTSREHRRAQSGDLSEPQATGDVSIAGGEQ